MEQDNGNNRTLTDIILTIEAKVDQLLGFHMSQDLSAKIASNKLNRVESKLDYLIEALLEEDNSPLKIASAVPSFSAPDVDEHQFSIGLETKPLGFPRTSRPETFATEAEMRNTVPSKRPALTEEDMFTPNERKAITQRVVDKNGKAIYMCNVSIINGKTGNVEHKMRTNGMGKYSASLIPGNYKVVLTKEGSAGKDRVEVSQNLIVNEQTPSELQTIILK